MKPLKLTMQAFGAYAGKETIDFTELQHEQIFIISGKTGAGKSTIFDAISFAIFGKNNTSDRDGISMRSHYASADELTEVSLLFKLGTRIFRIERTPQQEITKKRGEGTRTVNQKAVLYEIMDGEEKLLASAIRDVDSKISELMQLTVDQFRQILMIPQGEFRELLTSDSKEKEAILQRLAHTYIYKQMEDKLWEKEKKLADEIQQKRQAVILLAENGLDEKAMLSGMTTEEISQQFQTEISQKEEEQIESELQLKKVRKEADEAAEKWTLAKNIQTDFQYLERYQAELAQFEAKQKAVVSQIHTLQRAKQALRLQSQDANCIQLKARLTKRERELAEIERELAEATTRLQTIRKESDAIEAKADWIEERRKTFYYLENLEPKIIKWEALKTKAEDEQLAKLAAALEQNAQQIKELEQQKAGFDRQKEQLVDVEINQLKRANESAQQERELEIWRQKKQQLAELTVYREKQAATLGQLAVYEQQLAPLEEQVEALESQQKNQQAAVLAGHLHEGEACPVCGSTTHPELAVFSNEVDLELLAQTQEDLQHLQSKKEQLKAENQQITWQMSQLTREELPNAEEINANIASLTEALQKLASQAAEAERMLQTKQTLHLKIEKAIAAQQELEQTITKQQQSYETLKQQSEQIAAERTFLEQEIPAEYQNLQKFQQEKQQLQEQITSHDKQAKQLQEELHSIIEEVSRKDAAKGNVKQDVARTQQELDEERASFKQLLKEQEFASYDAYKQASLTDEEMDKLEKQIQAFQNDFEIAKSRYQDLSTKLANTAYPDLDHLEEVWQEKQQQRERLEEQTVKLRDRLTFKRENFQRFEKEMHHVAKQEQKYAELGFLADTARGKNERKLTFERYVLGAFLDTIIERANLRLAKMTGGRFQLSRKLDRSKGNAQSGLELEVYDAYTGYMRHVRTLSGGESFKTSLALALSLAEVVQEMAGGISLETMFIDEGFGTLDPESLEMAVECLLETQESGRLVGIISHVPELKERIPVRLEVTATNHGSTTEFIHML